jgi:hypothetical protein
MTSSGDGSGTEVSAMATILPVWAV